MIQDWKASATPSWPTTRSASSSRTSLAQREGTGSPSSACLSPCYSKFLLINGVCGIPVSADTWLSNIGLLFIVGRTHVLKRLMQPLSVIEDFDPLKDRAPGFLAGPEVPVPNQFVLEAAEKTLGDG